MCRASARRWRMRDEGTRRGAGKGTAAYMLHAGGMALVCVGRRAGSWGGLELDCQRSWTGTGHVDGDDG